MVSSVFLCDDGPNGMQNECLPRAETCGVFDARISCKAATLSSPTSNTIFHSKRKTLPSSTHIALLLSERGSGLGLLLDQDAGCWARAHPRSQASAKAHQKLECLPDSLRPPPQTPTTDLPHYVIMQRRRQSSTSHVYSALMSISNPPGANHAIPSDGAPC
ncbi:hypothetical protein BT67DRAFT_256633 [Trichocladium antarcticum]|uniref:Uncharacterized protein n=1 Tax=Trichocladium antarcticum TaxID=1450529 RepID=A0AAN6UM84_9PEZI|nr:hypothetical protein BT67DRAFT_256633 [Trichocladium antarcticum]